MEDTMKRFIRILCLSCVLFGAIFTFEKIYFQPDRLYLQGNRYLAEGQYKKAKWAYVAALNAGSGVQAYGGMLAVHYMSDDVAGDAYEIIKDRPADITYDEARMWMFRHISMAEYGALTIEQAEEHKFSYYDENHILKVAETYEDIYSKVKTEFYDENGNVIHMVARSSTILGYNYTDYIYENGLLTAEETVYCKGQDFYERREKILYFYDEKSELTEKHRYKYKNKAHLQEEDIIYIYIYNTDYPLVLKTVYEDGHGTVVYKTNDSAYTMYNGVKTEYYDTNWNMTYYETYKWLKTPQECGEYRTMGFDDLWSVHEYKRYSPDGEYLGKYIDIHNERGSWWGYRNFNKNNNLIEYVSKWEYQLQSMRQ